MNLPAEILPAAPNLHPSALQRVWPFVAVAALAFASVGSTALFMWRERAAQVEAAFERGSCAPTGSPPTWS